MAVKTIHVVPHNEIVHPVITLIPGYSLRTHTLPLSAYACDGTPVVLFGVGLKI